MIRRNHAHLINVTSVINDLDAAYLAVLHSGMLKEAAPFTPRIKNRI